MALVFVSGSFVYAGVQEEKKPGLSSQQFFENFKNKKFMGLPLDFDLKNADLENVINFISRISSLTFKFKDVVKGTVTLKEKQIPWDKAFYLMLEQNELELVLEAETLVIQKKAEPEEK